MQENEVLMLYVRSSIGVKKGVVLSNGTGIIDSSYYSNPSNDGNIGISLFNTSNKEVHIKAGERIAQGVFIQYLVTDDDNVLNNERAGGFGSSGK
jgi:dUTP pyrophosphatase